MPRLSGAERGERAGQTGEEFGLGMTGREGQVHAASGFDDACGDLDQPQPQRCELGLRQVASVSSTARAGPTPRRCLKIGLLLDAL